MEIVFFRLTKKKDITNLRKNGAVLLYLNRSGLDTLILCLVGNLL